MDGAKELVVIDGLPESPIDGLRLTDVVGSGQSGLVASYATNLQLSGVELNVENGVPFRFSHTPDLALDRVTSRRHPADVQVIGRR